MPHPFIWPYSKKKKAYQKDLSEIFCFSEQVADIKRSTLSNKTGQGWLSFYNYKKTIFGLVEINETQIEVGILALLSPLLNFSPMPSDPSLIDYFAI